MSGLMIPFRSIVVRLLVWASVAVITDRCERLRADDSVEARALAIFENKCVACHGEDVAESALRLDTPEHVLRGGDSGEPTIVPGDTQRSYLLERVTTADPAMRMPPDEERLADEELQILKDWVKDSQYWSRKVSGMQQKRTSHWSFQPLVTPNVPASTHSSPIDAFVGAKLHDAGLHMASPASRQQLIRRLFLVMHGLPPTPDQVDTFLADERPDAWDKLVDEVLNSPRYGERLATFWLDLIRFAETNGYETNRERPNAWHFRDWVIDSFNEDRPYDEFVKAQLAGDALQEPTGTGFLVAGPHDVVKGKDKQLGLIQRQDELDGIISATGATFLGLSTGCARCHNHKFDPISQSDYYSLQAVFSGVKYSDRTLPPLKSDSKRLAALEREIRRLHAELQPLISGNGADTGVTKLRPAVRPGLNEDSFAAVSVRYVRFNVQASSSSQPCLDELEILSDGKNVGLATAGAIATSSGDFVHPLHKLAHINDGAYGNERSWIADRATDVWVQIELAQAVPVNAVRWSRDRKGQYSDRLAVEYSIEVSQDAKSWIRVSDSNTRRSEKSAAAEVALDLSHSTAEEAEAARTTLRRLNRLIKERDEHSAPRQIWAGTFSKPGPTHRLYRGDPMAPREAVTPGAITALASFELPADTPEQQRRKALADWIADSTNPLTARVMVNRIWQHHFGNGIVATPSDFGSNGVPPSHPELLDWLATEFINNNWSVRTMHRMILLSQTWQQSSHPDTEAVAVDADSRLLWRFPPRRLEAEGIRDSILAVSGQLRHEGGGPGFSAFEVALENVRHYFPRKSFGPKQWRRMIYMTRVRQERDSVFGPFDCPDSSQLVAQRSRSTTPLQAMGLLNSRFVLQQAELLSRRLQAETQSDVEAVQLAWKLCFGRMPDADESQNAQQMIEDVGWNELTRALLNANEFVFIP